MTADVPVRSIMLEFARRTGLLSPEDPPLRYLWTDAFAVCNFLGLYEEHQDAEDLALALRLVHQTHHVLGRHRTDDARQGWISGLSEEEGEAHPTRGGLRIGKRWAERGLGEASDPELEWDRDGQYFHYMTRWMHALDRVAHVTRDASYRRWACELARAAFRGFTAEGTRPLCWKMSIALDRAQVGTMGHHDPLDGFITYHQLQAGAEGERDLDLGPEIRALQRLCAGHRWDTDDALGVGGLLCDAYRWVQVSPAGIRDETHLAEDLLACSLRGLQALAAQAAFRGDAERRLAFRELGLSIGLHAVERLQVGLAERRDSFPPGKSLETLLQELVVHAPLASHIERFWLDADHREARSWQAHRDINDVMLATSLAPAGYLELGG